MWPLAALSRWLPYRGKIYSKMHWEDLRVAAMDRWPPYGGGREGRFDCIYIYIYIYNLMSFVGFFERITFI